LSKWEPNKQEFTFVDCRQILNEQGDPYTMDMIRCDTGERVYFAGIELGSFEFVWVVKKYTVEVESG
jgi:hypothetical protein